MKVRITAPVAILVLALVAAPALTSAAVAGARLTGFVRVDQLGYVQNERKIAYLLTTNTLAGATFRVVNSGGQTALSRRADVSRGAWNAQFRAVQPLNFTSLNAAGTYRIVVDVAAGVSS